jgi:hypothetical protein
MAGTAGKPECREVDEGQAHLGWVSSKGLAKLFCIARQLALEA